MAKVVVGMTVRLKTIAVLKSPDRTDIKHGVLR